MYVTDALKVLTENTAKYAGGAMIKVRYYDMVTNASKPKEEKSGDEIVADIVKRAGLEIV